MLFLDDSDHSSRRYSIKILQQHWIKVNLNLEFNYINVGLMTVVFLEKRYHCRIWANFMALLRSSDLTKVEYMPFLMGPMPSTINILRTSPISYIILAPFWGQKARTVFPRCAPFFSALKWRSKHSAKFSAFCFSSGRLILKCLWSPWSPWRLLASKCHQQPSQ